MPDLEQKERALLWYDRIVTQWEKENDRYQDLRKSDDLESFKNGITAGKRRGNPRLDGAHQSGKVKA